MYTLRGQFGILVQLNTCSFNPGHSVSERKFAVRLTFLI